MFRPPEQRDVTMCLRIRASIILAVLLIATACSQSTRPARSPQSEALLRAAREGNADTVKALLAGQGADVNVTDERGSTPLLEAARYGHDDVVRVLLAAGANFKARDKEGKTALMLAAAGGHDEVVRVLKQAGEVE
jgi:ankyrin repeat protein